MEEWLVGQLAKRVKVSQNPTTREIGELIQNETGQSDIKNGQTPSNATN